MDAHASKAALTDRGGPGRHADTGMGAAVVHRDFAGFLDQHLPMLLRFGTALAGNPHDGADLVQTACEKVYRRWDSIEDGHQLPYLKATMANARISNWRKRRREWLSDALPEAPVADDHPVEHEPLWTAVRTLPRAQRAVIVLRYVEDHTEAEIAELLGIARGTVKSHASRALAHLQRDMTVEFPERRTR